MRFLTSGESHGKGLTVMIDDFPAGVTINSDWINRDLGRRQLGYGRGGRMKIEKDQVDITSGVRFEMTTGAPIALFIENRDFKNWAGIMDAEGQWTDKATDKKFTRPRPGHADLAGYYKYDHTDLRDVLERSSARETTARVAAGAVAKKLLHELGITVFSHVLRIGSVQVPQSEWPEDPTKLNELAESNDLRVAASKDTQQQMRQAIDDARMAGTTLGGEIAVIVTGVMPGLGTYVQWDRKLDGLLAQAVMSIQAVKSVSLGAGDLGGEIPGKDFHDEIIPVSSKDTVELAITRPANRAGGLEGGVTNGMPVVVKAVMKPISTMITPLRSVNLETGQEESAHFERSDVTAVPACGVVAEAMVAIILAQAVQDKFGHDTLSDIQQSVTAYKQRLTPVPVS